MSPAECSTPARRDDVFADGAMTVAEASRFSGIGRTRLYELMGRGELPYSHCGARRLIPRRGLVALLARGVDSDP